MVVDEFFGGSRAYTGILWRINTDHPNCTHPNDANYPDHADRANGANRTDDPDGTEGDS